MAKEVLALILAGGQSTRLGTLNKKLPSQHSHLEGNTGLLILH